MSGRPDWKLHVDIPVNGRQGKATVTVRGKGDKTVFQHRADLREAPQRRKVAALIAERFPPVERAEVEQKLEAGYYAATDRHREARKKPHQPKGKTCAAEILDAAPAAMRRPLTLHAGHGHAAAWPYVRV